MKPNSGSHDQDHLDLLPLYALHALSPDEASAAEAQISACPECRLELERLRPIVDSLISWPADILRPASSLWPRLAERIARDAGTAPLLKPPSAPVQSEWEEAAPGISVKFLATDVEKHSVAMLVRLVPGGEYPPHRHAGVEELHLLHGELMIDDKKLVPGDYIRAEAGSVDHRVWSQTGCTCVLFTSTEDEIL